MSAIAARGIVEDAQAAQEGHPLPHPEVRGQGIGELPECGSRSWLSMLL